MSALIDQRYTRNTQDGDFLKAQWKTGPVFKYFFSFAPTCHPRYTLKKMPTVDIEICVLPVFKRLSYMLGKEKNIGCWSLELFFPKRKLGCMLNKKYSSTAVLKGAGIAHQGHLPMSGDIFGCHGWG